MSDTETTEDGVKDEGGPFTTVEILGHGDTIADFPEGGGEPWINPVGDRIVKVFGQDGCMYSREGHIYYTLPQGYSLDDGIRHLKGAGIDCKHAPDEDKDVDDPEDIDLAKKVGMTPEQLRHIDRKWSDPRGVKFGNLEL